MRSPSSGPPFSPTATAQATATGTGAPDPPSTRPWHRYPRAPAWPSDSCTCAANRHIRRLRHRQLRLCGDNQAHLLTTFIPEPWSSCLFALTAACFAVSTWANHFSHNSACASTAIVAHRSPTPTERGCVPAGLRRTATGVAQHLEPRREKVFSFANVFAKPGCFSWIRNCDAYFFFVEPDAVQKFLVVSARDRLRRRPASGRHNEALMVKTAAILNLHGFLANGNPGWIRTADSLWNARDRPREGLRSIFGEYVLGRTSYRRNRPGSEVGDGFHALRLPSDTAAIQSQRHRRLLKLSRPEVQLTGEPATPLVFEDAERCSVQGLTYRFSLPLKALGTW